MINNQKMLAAPIVNIVSESASSNKVSESISKGLLYVTFISIFLMCLATNEIAITGAYFILCFWSLFGPKHAIKSLSLNYLILLLSPAIYELPTSVSYLRWLLLLVVSIRVLPTINLRFTKKLLPFILFYIVVAGLAWTVSPVFVISFLKITAFTLCATTVLVAFDSLNHQDLQEIKQWLISITIAVLLLSLPTLFLKNIGFFRNGTGFNGIFNHPQAFGVFLAPTAAYMIAKTLLDKKGVNFRNLSGVILIVAFIMLSRARTALLATILSVIVTYVFGIVRSKSLSEFSFGHSLLKLTMAIVVVLTFLATSEDAMHFMSDFLVKTKDKSFEKSFMKSRGGGVESQMKRFRENPLTGIGFGIDKDHERDQFGRKRQATTFMNIPVSSATEKGFLPVAILEEVGIIGVVFLIPLLFVLFSSAISSNVVGLLAMFFCCLLVNIGEAIFFSPGQLGGYMWLLMGLCTAKGWNIKNEI